MSLSLDEIQELSKILDARAGLGRKERPKLRLIVPPTPKLLDPIFREAHIKRVLFLQRAYRLQWLVDQACFNAASLSCLEDCDLIRLLNDMERARECIADGVSFEDAGLIRSLGERREDDSMIPSRGMRKQAARAESAVSGMHRISPIDPAQDEPPF